MTILDYIAGLGWVKDNIAAFGGNAREVVLFCQSPEADDPSVLASLPVAKRLVKSVVLESGGSLDVTPYTTTQYTGRSFAETHGCSSKNVGVSSLQNLTLKVGPQVPIRTGFSKFALRPYIPPIK